MDYQFTEFDTACFRESPRHTVLGDWTVEHLSFATPATADQTPIVFIGGAFQNAWSFLREVRRFVAARPIIIVDLPGQGQNNQISGDLSFSDLADLLRGFLDREGVDRIIPVGLSYGSGIAFRFGQGFPDRVERLVLGGVTERIRDRVDRALRASFWYLTHDRYERFADAVVHHLLNLPQREQTGVTDRLVERLLAGMLDLTEVERTRYRHNTTRLFRERLEGPVSCRTLVFATKYDHFTAPFEAIALAGHCTNADLALIERGDHLVPVENPRTLLALYDAFLNDTPLTNVEGVLVGEAVVEACRERRLLPRLPGENRSATVTARSGGRWPARLLDYNAHGCLLEMEAVPQLPDPDEPCTVSIPALDALGDAVLLEADQGARAVFLFDAFAPPERRRVTIATTPALGRRLSVAERLVSLPEE